MLEEVSTAFGVVAWVFSLFIWMLALVRCLFGE